MESARAQLSTNYPRYDRRTVIDSSQGSSKSLTRRPDARNRAGTLKKPAGPEDPSKAPFVFLSHWSKRHTDSHLRQRLSLWLSKGESAGRARNERRVLA